MDKAVVDSSVVIKWFVVEPYAAESQRVLHGYRTGDLTLLAPDLIYAEIGNIIWKKQRFHGLAAAHAKAILDAFQDIRFDVTSTAALLDEAYRLAIAHERTVYDALYLALSAREHCRYVTADEKFVNAVSAAFPNVVWVADWS